MEKELGVKTGIKRTKGGSKNQVEKMRNFVKNIFSEIGKIW